MIPAAVASGIRQAVREYLRTAFHLSDPQVEEALFRFLEGGSASARTERPEAFGDGGLFKGPYLDLRLPFRRADKDAPSPLDVAPTFDPYLHQLRAFERLASSPAANPDRPRSTLVTTGTGSGKTDCFQWPVLDHCLRMRHRGGPASSGIKAIILYPMNALAADQARRFARDLATHPALMDQGVTVGMYVGGDGRVAVTTDTAVCDMRTELRKSPPDILLTNYRMLDFLLLRPDDHPLWSDNEPTSLQYLVLDELHTYDGAQGSDVACLIRRLKARLSVPKGHLCCVGTSATVGDDNSAKRLLRFAEQVFGEAFEDDAIIGESRQSEDEALGELPGGEDAAAMALPDTPAEEELPAFLQPATFDDAESYMAAVKKAWLDDGSLDPVAVGDRLKVHPFLREVLHAADPKRPVPGRSRVGDASGIRHLRDVDRALCVDKLYAEQPPPLREALLSSFLSLVAYAKRRPDPDEERTEPFLTLRITLWMRELRRSVRRVADPTQKPPVSEDGTEAHTRPAVEFAWYDDARADKGAEWLPVVHCRECGASGWGALLNDTGEKLHGTPLNVGEAFLRHDKKLRFVMPFSREVATRLDENVPLFADHRLCCECLRVFEGGKETCVCRVPGPRTMPVVLDGTITEGKRKRYAEHCPVCHTDDALRLLGRRAASLSSVAITELYLSPLNSDRKLLAFTNAVQDASHLAGYFGARTYRFNVRTALQGVLEQREAPMELADVGRELLDHYTKVLPNPAEPSTFAAYSTFIPSDLEGFVEVERYLAKQGKERQADVRRLLERRLSYEAVHEFGLGSQWGHTLEQTGCSTAIVKPEVFERVVERIALDQQEKMLVSAGVKPRALRHFVWGLLERLRRRGGISHELLTRYIETGNAFQLSRKMQPLLPPLGGALPRFYTTAKSHAEFDSLQILPRTDSWVKNWAQRALRLNPAETGLPDLLTHVFNRLRTEDVLEMHNAATGMSKVYGLAPEALVITKEVETLRCSHCREPYVVGRSPGPDDETGVDMRSLEGAPCLKFRCEGKLRGEARSESYYARIYRAGRVKRIVAKEHTGLLARKDRESLEKHFQQSSDDRPDLPNLLTCTPTLELGIDVGDLSATLLCTVPPASANYLQRVGRAGRITGNALGLVLANQRAHDLYFFDEPEEMMGGEVTPPQLFLNAPDILARQLRAYCMDQWARGETKVTRMPRNVEELLTKQQRRDFPGRFLRQYDKNHEAWFEGFCGLFADTIDESCKAALRAVAQPQRMRDDIAGAYEEAAAEIASMDKTVADLGKRERAIEAEPPPDADELLEEIVRSRDALERMIIRKKTRYSLSVLTDASLLPNYAFPEPGVVLQGVVRPPRPKRGAGSSAGKKNRPKPKVVSYQRAARSALREFAPYNKFYAEGRELEVSQIDIGSGRSSRLEWWRLCAECGHAERTVDGPEASEPKCPVCGNPRWPDAGQRRTLVQFRRAESVSDAVTSVTDDAREERFRRPYLTTQLFEPGPKEGRAARMIDGMAFGWELHPRGTLRELNLGFRSGEGNRVKIGGREYPEIGFVTCKSCGAVQNPYARRKQALAAKDAEDGAAMEATSKPGSDGFLHGPGCGTRSGKKLEAVSLYLYREITSEALRILLPTLTVTQDETIASFKAALQLGLRRYFSGHPDHLGMATISEPTRGSDTAKRHYLLLYDMVPGGTGYLAELFRDDTLIEVLRLAQRAILACRCQEKPLREPFGQEITREGCYRCLYAYQAQEDIPHISREIALGQLRELLDAEKTLVDVVSVSDIPTDTRLESELEARFVLGLREYCEGDETAQFRDGLWHKGEPSHEIELHGARWRLEPQVKIGSKDGVELATQPDFVFWPEDEGMGRPVAVYCDGFAYHACPDDAQARIWDDIRKREALVESGKFVVWSVTWKDVESFRHDAQITNAPSLFSKVEAKWAYAWSKGLKDERLHLQSTMTGLVKYLAQPIPQAWEGLSRGLATALMQPGQRWDTEEREVLRDQLTRGRTRGDVDFKKTDEPTTQELAGRYHPSPFLDALVTMPSSEKLKPDKRLERIEVVLRLFDEQFERNHEDFEAAWRRFWHAHNLLQFHRRVRLESSERIARKPVEMALERAGEDVLSEPPPSTEAAVEEDPDFELAMELADDKHHEALRACRDEGLIYPEVGEVLMDGIRELGQVDLSWEDARVAVLWPGAAKHDAVKSALKDNGWTVVAPPEDWSTFAGEHELPRRDA